MHKWYKYFASCSGFRFLENRIVFHIWTNRIFELQSGASYISGISLENSHNLGNTRGILETLLRCLKHNVYWTVYHLPGIGTKVMLPWFLYTLAPSFL